MKNPTAVRAAVASVALAAAIGLTATTPAAAAPRTTVLLAVGSHSADVAALQSQLNRVLTQTTALETDGAFGRLTRDSVTWFQTCTGLEADGIAGPLTRKALADAVAAGRPVDTVCLRPAS
ncbi:peptidoglycan-binding protein [Kitasatospora sp. NPDC051853]|uniref:peptidoglycan-binding protein n=1 Tax=Kitasatospora sp. NPDC051853 TaxID=3364058 RepID=UPI0037ACEE12